MTLGQGQGQIFILCELYRVVYEIEGLEDWVNPRRLLAFDIIGQRSRSRSNSNIFYLIGLKYHADDP